MAVREFPLGGVLFGICGIGIGFLSGLLFAGMNQGVPGELAAQLKAEQEKNRLAETKIKSLSEEVAKANVTYEVFNQYSLKQAETILRLRAYWVKSQTVLGLVQNVEGLPTLLRNKKFRDKFKPDWFKAQDFAKTFGGRWFLQEIADEAFIDQGLVDHLGPEPSDNDERIQRVLYPEKYPIETKDLSEPDILELLGFPRNNNRQT